MPTTRFEPVPTHRSSTLRCRQILLSCAATLLACHAALSSSSAQETTPITFYAMGDVPYSAADYQLLPTQIAEIPADAEFAIHVGDIKRGLVPCIPPIYENVAAILRKSSVPVFVLPGDNEWNDCLLPLTSWKLWEQNFLRFEQHWSHRLPVFRSLEREENFSFVLQDTLFLGVNVVGGRVHDAEEWPLRHQQNLAWIRQNLAAKGSQAGAMVIFGHAAPAAQQQDFFEGLNAIANEFEKPILYLHGDGHVWKQDRPFAAKNILRVQVDQGGNAPPLKVTVDTARSQPFLFDRRLPE